MNRRMGPLSEFKMKLLADALRINGMSVGSSPESDWLIQPGLLNLWWWLVPQSDKAKSFKPRGGKK